jgi:alkylation response protein AidB-like acyl-CoA dehydrogenase
MEFKYTEEQLALQDTLQRFIARDYDFDKRRTFSASALGFSAEAWKQYAELGLLALPFPEEAGGLGGNAVDIMLVMEQFGQGLLLEPYLSTVVTCGGLIRDAASDALKQKLLPRIGAGELKLALAAYEAAGRYDLSYVSATAQAVGGKWQLSGRKTVVLDGASADYFLVSARSGGKVADRDGISLFLVPRDAKGLTIAAYPTQSGARAADLSLENVSVDADALIGSASHALPSIERAVDRANAALCAEAVGIMNALNQATLNYL